MSNLRLFLKQNKKVKENTKYAATKSLVDENGEPLLWEIRPIKTKEDEKLRDECIREVPIPGKPNMYRYKLDTTEYMTKLAVASIVFPNLYDAELQDSYGVKTPEDLLKEMIDDPGEYNELLLFIQNFNGFSALDDKVEEAKN
jgi:hypothetical protein